MKIYVASSWRNDLQPHVCRTLVVNQHDVYDFKNPPHGNAGFSWADIDPNWESWTVSEYKAALRHPIANSGFHTDLEGMRWADCCVLVLPCGRSAHSEAGYMAGMGKPVYVLSQSRHEPELMYKLFSGVYEKMSEVLTELYRLGVVTGKG